MKNLCVFMTFLVGLFLTGCQEKEEMQTISDNKAAVFKLAGDPRNVEEFMTPEDIQTIQDAYNSMQGKTFKGSVVEIDEPNTKGRSKDMITYYSLTEDGVPVCAIDGSYLFICVEINLMKFDWTFSLDITYAIGQNIDYSRGYYSPNQPKYNQYKKTYIFGEGSNAYRVLTDSQCCFEVELKNTPGYKSARISFPFQMHWDQRVNYINCCDVFIDQKTIEITYLK